jgi:fructose-1,6-bisphosphatase/inositol monophosphatase family enzyme
LPWDHLPVAFFAREAGAVVRRLDGVPFIVDDRTGLLVAQNAAIRELTRDALFGDRHM